MLDRSETHYPSALIELIPDVKRKAASTLRRIKTVQTKGYNWQWKITAITKFSVGYTYHEVRNKQTYLMKIRRSLPQ